MTDSTTLLPDKRQVAASLSRAAASYDSVAALQRQVGNQLLARLPADLQVASWLDLGSGTGYFSRVLEAASCTPRVSHWISPKECCAMLGRREARGISWLATPNACRYAMLAWT